MEFESKLEKIPLGKMAVVLECKKSRGDGSHVIIIWGPSGIHRVTISSRGVTTMRYGHRTDLNIKDQLNKWKVININSLDDLEHQINIIQVLEG